MKKHANMTSFEFLSEIIKKRRAIFPSMYTGEKVNDSIVREILECGNWAPTHMKTEPWRYFIICDQKLKELSVYLGEEYKNNTPKESFSELKFLKTLNKPLKSSHVIAVCMKRDPQRRLPEWEEIAALACSIQNMWLCCTALGLGSYWSTPPLAQNAREFLNLERNVRCFGWFYIGVPSPDLVLQGKRMSIEDKIKWMT